MDCIVHWVTKSQTRLCEFHIITLTSRLVGLLALMEFMQENQKETRLP